MSWPTPSNSMPYSHVCAPAFVTLVLAQLEKEPSSNVLALGPTSVHDEQSITKSGGLESRDLDQDCDKTMMALRGPLNHGANSYSYVRARSVQRLDAIFPSLNVVSSRTSQRQASD